MRVEIYFTGQELKAEQLREKTAVVIDTLRATSTITMALAQGVIWIEAVAQLQDAWRRGNELAKDSFLLCGEREGIKIAGFHLGNSPLEYQSEVVAGKKMILTTTNGTLTIERARAAEHLLIGSLLNRHITMEGVMALGTDVALCCAGTRGHFSLEDFVTAGAMVAYLKEKGQPIEGDDRVQTAWLLYQRYAHELVELMSCSQNGSRLVQIGQQTDIVFSAQVDQYPILVISKGKKMVRGDVKDLFLQS